MFFPVEKKIMWIDSMWPDQLGGYKENSDD